MLNGPLLDSLIPLGTVADWLQAIAVGVGAVAAIVTAIIACVALRTIQRVLVNQTKVCIDPEAEILQHPVYSGYTDATFVRMRVWNCGPSAARNCLGKVLSVTRLDTGEQAGRFEPQRVLWGGDKEYRDIMVNESELLTVGFKLKHTDKKLTVPKPSPQLGVPWDEHLAATPPDPHERLFTLYILERQGYVLDRSDRPNATLSYPPGEYRLRVRVSGENFKAACADVKLVNSQGYQAVTAECVKRGEAL